ncbi:MAG: hypothetical protein ABR555_19240, partial [Pyrinomonadaceae bacterium]
MLVPTLRQLSQLTPLRRRRIPKAVKDFDMLADIAKELMPSTTKKSKKKKITSATKKAAGAFLFVAAMTLQSCAPYRTIRCRDPHPDVQSRIFPERIGQTGGETLSRA